MAEWSIAPVLKTGDGKPSVSSNLTASAKDPYQGVFLRLKIDRTIIVFTLSSNLAVSSRIIQGHNSMMVRMVVYEGTVPNSGHFNELSEATNGTNSKSIGST